MQQQAYLIKGFLLGKDAPRPILDAIDAIIAGLGEPREVISGKVGEPELPKVGDRISGIFPGEDAMVTRIVATDADQGGSPLPPDSNGDSPPPKPRKKHSMSPEAREAARQRMIAMQARKRAEREAAKEEQPDEADSQPAAPAFTEAELRITVPVPRRKSQLADDDWPEIKEMLAAGRDRKLIASDYDEDPEDLDFFIASCQRREAKSPGEAGASPSGVASDATARPTW